MCTNGNEENLMQCPQCGHLNNDGDKFCSNCGSPLRAGSSIPPQYQPPQREAEAAPPPPRQPVTQDIPDDPGDPEWRMSSLPEPEPPRRRTWLWVLGGLLIFCVLLFCGFSVFLMTDTGQDFVNDLATRAAEIATPES